MDIVLNAVQLKRCLEPCNSLVGKPDKGFDLQYANVQLVIKDKILDIYASDTNIQLHSTYGVIEGEVQDIDVAIMAGTFYIIFSDITDENDTIKMCFKEKSVKVLYKKQQYTLSYFYNSGCGVDSASVFLEATPFKLHINAMYETVKQQSHTHIFSIEYSKLKQVFNNLIPCMSKSPAESHIHGVYYDGNFYASNGYSFTGSYLIGNSFPTGEIKHLFFPNQIMQFLLKIPAQDSCSVDLWGNIICLTVNDIQILFRSNSVNFVPVSALKTFLTRNDKSYTISTAEVGPVLKKILAYSDFLNKAYAEITFKPEGQMHITASDGTKKSSTLEYETAFDRTPLDADTTIGIVLDTVVNTLAQITGETTKIRFNTKTTIPLVFSNEDDTQLYYISPTKITTKE